MSVWGRRIQLLASLLLVISPFFSWARVEVLGVPVGIPGLLFTGGVLLAVGLLGCTATVVGAKMPGFMLAGAAASGAVLWRAAGQIVGRTEYVLARAQLSLADANAVLSRFGLEPVQLYQRQASGTAYLADGLWLACGAAGLLGLGAVLEAAGHARDGLKPWSVLLGWPRCARCGFRVEHRMRFCPGCGRSMGGRAVCPECRSPLQRSYRFCPACGAAKAVSLPPGEGRSNEIGPGRAPGPGPVPGDPGD